MEGPLSPSGAHRFLPARTLFRAEGCAGNGAQRFFFLHFFFLAELAERCFFFLHFFAVCTAV